MKLMRGFGRCVRSFKRVIPSGMVSAVLDVTEEMCGGNSSGCVGLWNLTLAKWRRSPSKTFCGYHGTEFHQSIVLTEEKDVRLLVQKVFDVVA
jgi:hypothetical protein